jgi:uncharacterized membrane protein
VDKPIQLVNPNFHVILIHLPIGLLVAGTIIELLSFMYRRHSFRAAGRWMILLGALATIPAATTGLYAARQAMGSPEDKLVDVKREAPLNAEEWDQLRHHIKLNSSATVILAVLVIAWVGASDRIRSRGHIAYLIVLLIAVGLIICGSWHGGEMVYANQMGTNLVKGGWPPAAEKEKEAAPPENKEPTVQGKWAFDALRTSDEQLRKISDTVDIHVQLAGWTAALAVITLGLSLRNLWLDPNRMYEETATSDDDIANAIAGKSEQRSLRTEMTPPPVELPPRVPASRFWLLAALLGLITALIGWALIGPSSMPEATKLVKDYPRYMAHTVAGVSIVVLALILALITRFGPHNRLMVGLFSLLLALALASQVWFGILLLYDTNEGPIRNFNAAPTSQSSVTLMERNWTQDYMGSTLSATSV